MRKVLLQFWRLIGLCIRGPGGKIGLVMYGFIVALELAGVAVSLRIIEWTRDFYSALEAVNATEALTQVGVFGIIVLINTTRSLTAQYVRKLLLIRWRRSLIEAARDVWLGNKAYWHLAHRAGAGQAELDNPDQRIADDTRLFLQKIVGESIDLIGNIVAIFSYVAVLWSLSTFALPLNFIGIDAEIPRYMLWAAFIYVALCSLLTHVLGSPLKALYVEQQKREADFRFALARLRGSVDEVALANGEPAERLVLDQRFGGIIANWKRLINRELILGLFTFPYQHTVLRIPLFVALPGYLAGGVNFGGLMQISTAFSSVVTTLSWFIFSYKDLADLVAASTRLDNFLFAARSAPPDAEAVQRDGPRGPVLELSGVTVSAPDGRDLVTVDGLQVAQGEAVWLRGPSGRGKTTLLKALAGLWPHARGRMITPQGEMFFGAQRSYLPLGDLRAAVAFPGTPDDFTAEQLDMALAAVGLDQHTAAGLSGGEQQRLTLARLLLRKPEWVVLDEPTSALDVAAETELFAMLREKLPRTSFIVVSHREPQGLGPVRIIDLDPSPARGEPQPAFA